MFNLCRRITCHKPGVLIFTCPTCGNIFAQHRSKCRFVPQLGGDRFYCKCTKCEKECSVRARAKNAR